MKNALFLTASFGLMALAGALPSLSQAQVLGGSGALGGSLGGSLGGGSGSLTGQAGLGAQVSGVDSVTNDAAQDSRDTTDAAKRDTRAVRNQTGALRNDASNAGSVDTSAQATTSADTNSRLRGMIDARAKGDATVNSDAAQSTIRDGAADVRSDAARASRQARSTVRGVAGTTGNADVGVDADVSASDDASADAPH